MARINLSFIRGLQSEKRIVRHAGARPKPTGLSRPFDKHVFVAHEGRTRQTCPRPGQPAPVRSAGRLCSACSIPPVCPTPVCMTDRRNTRSASSPKRFLFRSPLSCAAARSSLSVLPAAASSPPPAETSSSVHQRTTQKQPCKITQAPCSAAPGLQHAVQNRARLHSCALRASPSTA